MILVWIQMITYFPKRIMDHWMYYMHTWAPICFELCPHPQKKGRQGSIHKSCGPYFGNFYPLFVSHKDFWRTPFQVHMVWGIHNLRWQDFEDFWLPSSFVDKFTSYISLCSIVDIWVIPLLVNVVYEWHPKYFLLEGMDNSCTQIWLNCFPDSL